MVTWSQLLDYSGSKTARAFDFFVVVSIAIGNINQWLAPLDVALYLPWTYQFWFTGGVSNIAGVFLCRALAPPEIRLHRSVEAYLAASRSARAKTDEDDNNHALEESSLISSALFSGTGIELSVEQKQKIASQFADHLRAGKSRPRKNHSTILIDEWKAIDTKTTWRKLICVTLFTIGLCLYFAFLVTLVVKGWTAIGPK